MSEEGCRGKDVVRIRARGVSDVGRVRSNNEDSLVACDLSTGDRRLGPFDYDIPLGREGLLLGVADGMGGEAGGELASQICVDELSHRLLADLSSAPRAAETPATDRLRAAILAANERILHEAAENPAYRGMGTTITAALLRDSSILVAQVGDSRAYLIRNQEARLLTRDQTLLNYLNDIGAEPAIDFENDPRKNILIQAVGTSASLEVKFTNVEVCPEDVLLVCSDGLYNLVSPSELVGILAAPSPLERQCQALVDRANAHGGPDNVTAVVAVFAASDGRAREPGAREEQPGFVPPGAPCSEGPQPSKTGSSFGGRQPRQGVRRRRPS